MRSPWTADEHGCAPVAAAPDAGAAALDEVGKGIYACTTRGGANTGIVVGDDGVLVFDAQATPALARSVIDRVRQVTDKPIRHVVLSHHHAARVLGASAYAPAQILCSDVARDLIAERGEQDKANAIARHPGLFQGAEPIRRGLVWPTTTFSEDCSIWLGRREVRLMTLGRGHTAGDIVAWIPDASVCFAGELVANGAAPYCGDAHFEDWPATLDDLSQLGPVALLPGRGAALKGPALVSDAVADTRAFVCDLYGAVVAQVEAGRSPRETFERVRAVLEPVYGDRADFVSELPFNVSRAHDEAGGLDRPRIWTSERDRQVRAELLG